MQKRAVLVVLLAQLGAACDADVLVERDDDGEGGADAPGLADGSSSGDSPDVAVGEGAPAPSCNVQDTTPIALLECGFELTPDAPRDLQEFAFQLVGTWFCHDPAFDFSTSGSLGVVFQPGGRYQLLVNDDASLNDDAVCASDGSSRSGSWYVERAQPGAPGAVRLIIESDEGIWSAHDPELGNAGTALLLDSNSTPLLRL